MIESLINAFELTALDAFIILLVFGWIYNFVSIAKLKWRQADLLQKDTLLTEMLDKLYKQMIKLSDDQTQQHQDMRTLVHEEVRRIEEKISTGRGELFQRIDKTRDDLLATMTKP